MWQGVTVFLCYLSLLLIWWLLKFYNSYKQLWWIYKKRKLGLLTQCDKCLLRGVSNQNCKSQCSLLKRGKGKWNYRMKMSQSLYFAFLVLKNALCHDYSTVYFLPYLLHIIKLSTSHPIHPILIYIWCYLRAVEFRFVLWAMSLEDTESLFW